MEYQDLIDQLREFCELSRGNAEGLSAECSQKGLHLLSQYNDGRSNAYNSVLAVLEEMELNQ